MDVDVVRLRRQGERIGLAELKATKPVRGSLTVMSRLGHNMRDQVIVATLVGEKTWPAALPVLDHMRMTKLHGDSFILFGFEEVELSRRRIEVFPQAWWCRLVRDPAVYDHYALPVATLDELEMES